MLSLINKMYECLISVFKSNSSIDSLNIIDLKKRLKKLARNPSYSDILTYSLMLDDSIILHKDGALSMSFKYFGPDIESETDGSVDILSAKINHALSQLEEGWMVEANLISAHATGYNVADNYHDVVSEIIDIEREHYFQQEGVIFKTDTVLTFTFTQTNEQIEKLKKFSIDQSEEANTKGLDDLTKRFKLTVNGIVNLLDAYNIQCVPLKGSELMTYLFNCVNCVDEKLAAPKTTMFLDSYLVEQDFRAGLNPKVGKKHIAVLALDEIPAEYYPTILDELSELRLEFRWSTRFTPLPEDEAKRIFKKKYTEFNSKEIGIGGMLAQMMGNYNHQRDHHAQEMKEQAKQATTDQSAGMLFGYMNSTIVIYHENYNLMLDAVAEITKKIKSKGFSKVRLETINATETFFGSLPSHGGYNPRKIPVSVEFIADIFPTTGIYQGEPFAPNPTLGKDSPPLMETTTRGSRKFNFNLHFKDVGNTAIYGPTGTGKSTLIGMTCGQWLKKYPNARIIGFDYNFALLGTTLSLGGKYLDFSTGKNKLSPFIGIKSEKYRKGFFQKWLFDVFELTSETRANDEQKNAIIESLALMSEMPEKAHNINKFISQLNDLKIQSAFKTFKESVPYDMLSGTGDDNFFDCDFVMFDKKGILDLARHVSIPTLSYINYKISEELNAKHRPTLMPNDEAWIDFKEPILCDQLMQFIRTGRHNDVSVILSTQGLSEVVNSEHSEAIRGNLRTEIYLPNDKMQGDKKIMENYEAVGLNAQELQVIGYAIPKREYYVRQTIGNKLMQLEVGALALSFLGMTVKDEEKMARFHEIYNPNDETWAFEWLRYCGFKTEATALEQRLLPLIEARKGVKHAV